MLIPRFSVAVSAAVLLSACPGPDSSSDAGTDGATGGENPPTITGINPSQGPEEGGTTVLITGDRFATGAKVYFGSAEGTDVNVTSEKRLTVTSPKYARGTVDLKVTNPDGQSATAPSAFTYTSQNTVSISEAQLQGAAVVTDSSGMNPVIFTVRADVQVPGVTDGTGAGAGVRAEVGFAEASSTLELGDLTWTAAIFESDVDGPSQGDKARDRYMGTVSVPGASGSEVKAYALAARFSVDEGQTWVIADLDGAANGSSVAQLQRLEVSQNSVDWCRLGGQSQGSPPNLTLKTGEAGPTIFVQIFEAHVTNAVGAGAGISAQLGHGAKGSNPATANWTWTDATFNVDTGAGANDEFKAVLQNPGVGEYSFAYRVRVNAGPWRYCDANGSGPDSDFELAQMGTLSVSDVALDNCKLQHPPTLETREGVMSAQVFGRVWMTGVTNGSGQGAGISGELGYGPATDDPADPSWTWVPATYNVDAESNAADEYKASFVGPAAGTYRYAYRFWLGTGAKRYCDLDGGAFDATKTGVLTAKVQDLDSCTLDGPATYSAVLGGTGPSISARVRMEGITSATGQGAGIEGELGIGPYGSDPTTAGGWTWVAASFVGDQDMGQSDGYVAAANVTTPGSYTVAYRFRFGTKPFVYCDRDGSTNGLQLAQLATLHTVPKCTLQGITLPGETTAVTSGISGRPLEATARLSIPGVTNQPGAAPNVIAQVGLGGQGANDATTGVGWGWQAASFKEDDASGDELWSATFTPAYTGSRAASFRFSTDNGQTWAYCDLNGNDVGGYSEAQQPKLSIARHDDLDFCRLQFPTQAAPGDTIFGQVFETGVTPHNDAASAEAAFVAELGYGRSDEDPGLAWTWKPATFNVKSGNNDEFKASFPTGLAKGTWNYAYRFRKSAAGSPWCFGDLDGTGANSGLTGFNGGSNLGEATVP